MRRRLEIARGLMHSPRVLFLDEPTIGLDPQTRSSIWGYIRQLQESEEITIFMTTHYMDEAEFCGRIAIMDHGEIVALDTPEALKEAVGADRVRIETDDDGAAIEALGERFGLEATISEGAVSFAVPEGEEFVPRLFAELGVPIRSVSVSRPTLDDVFMSHTGTTIRDAEESSAKNRAKMQRADDGEDAGVSSRRADRRGRPRPRAAAQLAQRAARGEDRLVPRADPLRQRPGADRHLAGPAAALPLRARRRACSSSPRPAPTAST